MRKCKICLEKKDDSCFATSGALQCRECLNRLKREYRKTPECKAKLQASDQKNYIKNREKKLQSKKKGYYKNQHKRQAKQREYYHSEKGQLYLKNNKEKIAQKTRKWQNNNREHCAALAKKRYHAKYKFDLQYRLKKSIRIRIIKALQGHKSCHTEEYLGCSIEKFRLHLESQFRPKMTWENYGKFWSVDHIRPCSSFDFKDFEQQKECFNFKNSQPLWNTTKIARKFGDFESVGNFNKGDKWDVKIL